VRIFFIFFILFLCFFVPFCGHPFEFNSSGLLALLGASLHGPAEFFPPNVKRLSAACAFAAAWIKREYPTQPTQPVFWVLFTKR
jgi:hypothetical protein